MIPPTRENTVSFLKNCRGDFMGYGQDYDKYICDDRGQLEHMQMIREMSDEEFERYLEKLKAEEKN